MLLLFVVTKVLNNIQYFKCLMTNDKKHLSVPITPTRLLKLNLWCKIEGITQEEGIGKIIDGHVPEYRPGKPQ